MYIYSNKVTNIFYKLSVKDFSMTFFIDIAENY